MSGGTACQCEERQKPPVDRDWCVLQRQCNHSAFNGGRWTPSEWSHVMCMSCGASWRTKARYVRRLPDAME